MDYKCKKELLAATASFFSLQTQMQRKIYVAFTLHSLL